MVKHKNTKQEQYLHVVQTINEAKPDRTKNLGFGGSNASLFLF